ncbi:hypothetical protein BC829DRAFT_106361 [Chytridium lagenaria]|nr:hypothetical protein BC829DRAFT_106361 [Chytridium lagenaria]
MASMSPRAVSLPTIDSIYPGRTASKKTASTNSPKAIVNEVDSTTLKEEVPDLAIVEEQLDRILDTLGMPSQLRTEIKTLPTDRKWQIVQLSKVTDQPTCLLKKVTSGITPQSFINTLSHPKAITPNLFTSLRVCVSNEPKSWTSEFLELDGLQILFNFIDKVIKKSTK